MSGSAHDATAKNVAEPPPPPPDVAAGASGGYPGALGNAAMTLPKDGGADLAAVDGLRGGLRPLLAAGRCHQLSALWAGVGRALESDDLEATRAAAAQARSAAVATSQLLEAVETELQRREDFAASQERARQQIEEAVATIHRDVGALGDALAQARGFELPTEDLTTLMSSIVEEERKEVARRALAAAVSNCSASAEDSCSAPTSCSALKAAIELAESCGLSAEEQQLAREKLAEERSKVAACRNLASVLMLPQEQRDLEAVGAALQQARVAGVSEEQLLPADEVWREGQRSSIWNDIISIIAADDGHGDGASSALAAAVGLCPAPEEEAEA